MKDHLFIDGRKIELTDEQSKQIMESFGFRHKKLADFEVGEVFKIFGRDFIVLEHIEGVGTAIISREILDEKITFAENGNNYDGSHADEACNECADSLTAVFGADNIVEHEVDLTADDGLKDYGVIRRKVSVLTAERYRRYVYILDKYKVNSWWWLATPCSTKAHEWDTAAKCVAPSGCICNGRYGNGGGVRPFCILKSNIFVSG